jgi:hypothetical protein
MQKIESIKSTAKINLLTIGLSALSFNASVRATEQVSFKGHFIPIVHSSVPIDATHVRLEIEVQVQATQLGKAQGPAWALLDLTTFAYVAGANWAAANGDAVSITFEGQFLPTDTGGTGRFEAATAAGVVGGFLDAGTLLPLGKGAPFVGTISSPGSLHK